MIVFIDETFLYRILQAKTRLRDPEYGFAKKYDIEKVSLKILF